jgi:hypothetical protein
MGSRYLLDKLGWRCGRSVPQVGSGARESVWVQLGNVSVKIGVHQCEASDIGNRHYHLLYRIQNVFIEEKELNSVKCRKHRSGKHRSGIKAESV